MLVTTQYGCESHFPAVEAKNMTASVKTHGPSKRTSRLLGRHNRPNHAESLPAA